MQSMQQGAAPIGHDRYYLFHLSVRKVSQDIIYCIKFSLNHANLHKQACLMILKLFFVNL